MKYIFVFAIFIMNVTFAQNILNNTDHLVNSAVSALSILGAGSIIIDQTCPSGSTPGISCLTVGGPGFVSFNTLISDATNVSATLYSANSATVVNHAPYKVLNQSSTDYMLSTLDQAFYSALIGNDLIYNIAYCGIPMTNDYPPIAASTILPNNAGAGTVGVQSCGYAPGIEFSMTLNYKGMDTSSPSATTESMTAILAKIRANHPTWNWADIKGALRQTASNWSTGYAPFNASGPGLGFGNVNYDNATALAAPANIFLEAPGMAIVNSGHYAAITLYPYKSTRRVKEVVYIGGSWPAASTVNELTAAQVTAAGGTLIYTSNGTDITPQFSYAPSVSGTAIFRALTLDGSGNASRVESFSAISETFTVGTACFQ
jgi:hypothetical protein